ncbi:MAG: GH92 family glycosyl hydrolase [Planctomycetota bacterium]
MKNHLNEKMIKMKKSVLSILVVFLIHASCSKGNKVVWQIGENNNSGFEFALAPNRYREYIASDFGWEDKFYLIGTSQAKKDWPYIIPGTSDNWGGTWQTSGWRSSTLNILFGIDRLPNSGDWKLIVDVLDCNSKDLPLFKVSINGKSWKCRIPSINIDNRIDDEIIEPSEYLIEIPVPDGLITKGGNEIRFTTLEGSWLKFDQVKLEGPDEVVLTENDQVHLRSVQAADYEIKETNAQPLLVDVQHLKNQPELKVILDGQKVFTDTIQSGRYIFEVPMSAVESAVESRYEILIDETRIQSGKVVRNPKDAVTAAGYVDTKIGTAHSRWMIAPGPWMPFSMVKLSPDNQNDGWQAGYEPTFESVGAFTHIHEWTMSGLGTMPTNGPLQTKVGDQKDVDSGYRSRINKETEVAPIGYYSVELTDYDIRAELTATTRCGFQRYTFPKNRDGSRVLLDLVIPAEYRYNSIEAYMKKTSDKTVEGYSHQLSPNTWSGGISQEYVVHFVAEFDQPISNFSVWTENGVREGVEMLKIKGAKDVGAIVEFDTKKDNVVKLRTGISYVSIENAQENLDTEVTKPYGWDFDAVRRGNVDTWDDLFRRIKIASNDRHEKMRFYNNMYRSICSRNIFSDVNGEWMDADEQLRKMEDPSSPALGCDAFWNTFWNLNQFWNLVTPEWSNRWVRSQLAMYDTNGWLAKGPAGMEYIPVMVAEHEIPLIVGIYQMGIRDYDVEKAYEAVKKMQTTPGRTVGGGYAGNRDLVPYLKYKYVPYDKGRFSNSLEYSYDDWNVSQFAKALGKEDDYKAFLERGYYWKNIIDSETGFARMKDSTGQWLENFDPYKSGANKHYVEGNAWQLTYFVPQDVPALAEVIGKDRFVERLDWGFRESDKTRFNGMNDQYWNYPVVQGNQQSMHFAFLFNWVGYPWLTQKWSRAIMSRYYGYGLANAYLGDEDQGQMSAWFIMASIGLFQTDGGCRVDPIYEIGSPLFERIEIDLGGRYNRGDNFTIEAKNASRLNMYVQSAKLNGKILKDFKFPASELLRGGKLELEMGPEPNKSWGIIEQTWD